MSTELLDLEWCRHQLGIASMYFCERLASGPRMGHDGYHKRQREMVAVTTEKAYLEGQRAARPNRSLEAWAERFAQDHGFKFWYSYQNGWLDRMDRLEVVR